LDWNVCRIGWDGSGNGSNPEKGIEVLSAPIERWKWDAKACEMRRLELLESWKKRRPKNKKSGGCDKPTFGSSDSGRRKMVSFGFRDSLLFWWVRYKGICCDIIGMGLGSIDVVPV
jgi:hypothetical protein